MEFSHENLSTVWSHAFRHCMTRGVDSVYGLSLSVTGFRNGVPNEDPGIRAALEEFLYEHGKFSVATTASTIFPVSLWNPATGMEDTFARYNAILPYLKRMAPQNRNGMYFERMTSYGSEQRNQLRTLIEIYRGGNHRSSAFQVAIYDPRLDQRDQRRRGFPCLQQVAFIPSHQSGELRVHGFYATQYVFDRAYGNLLGLSHLGSFVANELGLELAVVTSTAALARLGDVSKEKLLGLDLFVSAYSGEPTN